MAKISSDDIKEALVEKFGGTAGGWKRQGKKTNAEGHVEREFEENALGLCVVVTESEGGLSFAAKPPAEKSAGLPVLEKDHTKIAVARKTLKRILEGDTGDEEEEIDDAMPKLLAQSGETAFANQFFFGIVSTDPAQTDYMIYINAAKSFRDAGFHDNDTYYHVQRLLPRCADDPSGQNYFECTQGIEPTHAASGIAPAPPPLEMARLLLQRGFIWDAAYQQVCEKHAGEKNYVDTREIKALTARPTAVAPPKP